VKNGRLCLTVPNLLLLSWSYPVYKWNHDSSYNGKLPADSIKHVYIEKFEFLENCEENCENLNKFLMDYGRTLL
jgi:hypothetical protein